MSSNKPLSFLVKLQETCLFNSLTRLGNKTVRKALGVGTFVAMYHCFIQSEQY